MATFSHLPTELVEYVISYLAQPYLNAFSRVNKALHALTVPILYRNVDLFIPPGDKLPRIDRFCMNVISDSRLAARIETLRLGLAPTDEVRSGQHWLPPDRHLDNNLLLDKAIDVYHNESMITGGDYLGDAIRSREYGAFAALILLVLPNLQQLDITDFKCAALDLVHTTIRNLDSGASWNKRRPSQALLDRLSSIKRISVNCDNLNGQVYPRTLGHSNLDPILNLPGITKLELSIPSGQWPHAGNIPLGHPRVRQLVSAIRPTNITTLVIKHSGPLLQIFHSVLECTPQLQSLTYALFYDCKERDSIEPCLIDLLAWSDALQQVKTTLKTLVFSVEYCDTYKYPFQQPRIGDKISGYLDLTNFSQLHTLEVPFPFLTGDVEFSITADIYPLLPPNLRHLSLLPDLSHAQLSFPFDTSILPCGLTFQESESEARHLMNARMDVSYMFHASLILLEFASYLETISVWQPSDPSLCWFDGQVADFAMTCRNKGISGKIIFPMLLRWRKSEHWNLIKEVTVLDRTSPSQGFVEKFHREEWEGIPLGLASQYHIHALRSRQVKLRR